MEDCVTVVIASKQGFIILKVGHAGIALKAYLRFWLSVETLQKPTNKKALLNPMLQ